MKDRMRLISVLVVVALVLGALPAAAQTPAPGFSGPLRASRLIGYNVINPSGDGLGQVEDLLVYLGDQTSGAKIAYAVVGYGGFLGIGRDRVAVPMGALVMDEARASLILPIDDISLGDAPTFDADTLPDINDPNWDSRLRAYWTDAGLNPDTAFLPTSDAYGRAYQASELLDMDVVNADGDELGEVGDLILQVGSDRRAGRTSGVSIGYAIIRYGGFLGIGESTVAVPLSAMTLDTENDRFVLPVTADVLDAAPQFSITDLPGVVGPGWDADARGYWEGLGYTMPNYDLGTSPVAAAEGGPFRASQILGYPVMSLAGDNLGTIDDLLLDFFPPDVATTSAPYLYDYGRVYYAVISVSALEGTGPDRVIVPMAAMSLDPIKNAFVIEVADADLANAPLFNPDDLPMPGQTDWDTPIVSYWRAHGFQNLPSRPQVDMPDTTTPSTATTPAADATTTPMPEVVTTGTATTPAADATAVTTPTAVK